MKTLLWFVGNVILFFVSWVYSFIRFFQARKNTPSKAAWYVQLIGILLGIISTVLIVSFVPAAQNLIGFTDGESISVGGLISFFALSASITMFFRFLGGLAFTHILTKKMLNSNALSPKVPNLLAHALEFSLYGMTQKPTNSLFGPPTISPDRFWNRYLFSTHLEYFQNPGGLV